MIHLSGLTAIDNENTDRDIRVEFSEVRHWEKSYEELLIGNNVVQSEYHRIMQAKESKLTFDEVSICANTIKSARKIKMKRLLKNSC